MFVCRVVLLQAASGISPLADEARKMIDFQMFVQLILIEIMDFAEVTTRMTLMRLIVEISFPQVSETDE